MKRKNARDGCGGGLQKFVCSYLDLGNHSHICARGGKASCSIDLPGEMDQDTRKRCKCCIRTTSLALSVTP